jgi:beta-N-acetylglucosaminidase
VDIAEVELYMFDEDIMVSSYHIQDGSLIHTICTDMVQGSSASYPIGPAPKGLEENVIYYSYDGHWFYADLKQMANDKRNDSTDNAVNQEAYYNFYQYMPHRSYSSITAQDINDFLESRGINASADTYPCEANQSVLYDAGTLFTGCQKAYGVNGAMIVAVALNESGYGQSQYAIENNNIFGHAVYDEAPDAANSYVSLEQCIISHALHFIQQEYANPQNEKYNGSWFGNKESGINVNYASDPYWAEKAAFFYYQLEPDAYKENTLITKVANRDISVYNGIDKDVLYTYEKGDTASFLVIKEQDGWLQVRSELPKGSIDDLYTEDSVGYIKKADLR